MTNTNLQDIRCPACGHEDGFHIQAIVRLYVTDNGTRNLGSEDFWDDESHCMCGNRNCDYDGAWCTFFNENQTTEGGAV
jgi:hypothetical protein